MNKRATENNLNDEQFATLKDKYIDLIVDSMTTKDLIQYVANDMQDFLDKLSEFEVYEEIKYTLDEEMLGDFIKQIKGKITD